MKRFFPLLILLAVLANTFPAAWADSDTGAPGITVEEEVSTVLPTATPEIKTAATTAPASAYDDPSFLNGYARVCRDGANVEGDAPTTLSEGAIVYAYDRDLNDRLAVAFNSRNGVVLGWMQSTDVCPLSEAETNALLDIQRACAINFFDAERTIPLVNVDAGNVERTVEPTASAEPEITVVATASAEPEITATPTASIEPEVTAALTVTVEPEITVAPTASIAPEITVAPTVTITPEITAAPTVSVGPEITVAPTVTITPEITVAPTVSVGPEITVAPTVSVEPALYASTASSLNAPLSANASAPIALNSADAKKMGVGGFMQLRPESLNNPAWASWNETVATVNESGVVTAVGAGSAYIVAQEGEGESAKSESWLIEVIAAPVKLACPSVLYIGYGETRKLDVDTDCPYEWLSYATSKSKYVRVDQNGNLYGARRGNAYVTVKSYNGLSATVRVYVVKAPSKVYISLPYSKMGVGESMQLGYSLPSGTASRITWEVSDETLATIDANGKITALKEGTVYVRGVAFNGKFAYASIQIKPAPSAVSISESIVLGVGQNLPLNATVNAESVCHSFTYESLNPEIATVNANGQLTGISEGACEIEVSAYNGATGRCAVTVKNAPTRIEVPANVLYIGYGESATIQAATDNEIAGFTYSTSKSKYVRVDQNGNIYGARRGNAYITIKTYNGLSATIHVYVVKAPKKVYISVPCGSMGVGESMQLGYSLPSGTASKIRWEVSDETLANIDANGKLTALQEGTVYVRCITYNGKFAYASIQIKPEPTSVNVAESLILGVEQKQKLPASVNAESACSSFTFKSLNPEVVSVTESGILAAIAQGVCEIEVTTYNHVTAKCTVTVKPAPTRIDLTDTVLYIGLGETARISASTDSSVSGFTYSTSKSKYVRVSSDGYVYGARRGNAIITVRTYNGLSASVRVYVRKAPGKVYLSIPNRTLGVGETMFMRYSLPSGTSGSVSWEISDASYATVDASGAFTALKEGTVYVRAVTYNGKYAYAPIQIKPAPTSVIVAESMTIGVGQNRVLSANVNAESACSSYTFKSLNPEIASVSEFGVITGKSEGICEIEVAAYNGVTARCTVTAKPAPTKIIVPSAVMYIGVGETVAVSAATDSEISGFTYSTSKSKYVRVDQNGNVYGARRGDAYITIRTYNGLTAAVRVYVRKAPTRVYISSPRSILGVGETVSLRYSLSSGASGSVIWEISEPEYATVNAKGQLTALKEGTVYVRAVTYNGKYDYMPIQIKPAPEWISTDFVSISMGTGEKRKIQVQLSEGSYSQLLYTSSDPSIAAVDAGGTITAVNRGTATILVETSVESVFAQISVEVWNAPAWVKLDAAKTLNVDETMQLTPEIDEDARTSWTFTSSNTNVATINAKGEVTALNRGQTILTARAYNGVSAQMALTVLDPWYPESVEIANAVEILNVGDTWSIETVVTPETAVPRLKWSSSNPNVAAIDENGKVTAVSGGFAYITCISEKNGACRTTILLCVKSGTLALTLPKRQTDVSGISENLSRIQAIKSSAFDEINELQRKGLITASDAAKRKSVLTNAFADYSFVWMTPAYQRYWKEANSENGAKDFKPGVVYYGMPYISGSYANRRYDHTKAINEGRYTDSGNGYYLLNQSRLLNGLYVGNDCSSFCNAANWGTSSSRIGDRTGDIYSSSYYKTVSLGNLRPGDLICLENRHVVFFLYYVDSAHTQIMILENGGAEAGVNTVHCSLYPLSYYSSLGYRGRRLKTLG